LIIAGPGRFVAPGSVVLFVISARRRRFYLGRGFVVCSPVPRSRRAGAL